MKFSEFYRSSDKDKLLSLEKSEQEQSTGSSNKSVDQIPYVVVPGRDAAEWGETLLIADVERGTVVGRISARGRLISHPVVHGDKCSFAVQQQDGSAIGTTHELPSGSLSTTFRIGGAGAADVDFNPIFKRQEDLEDQLDDYAMEPGSKLAQQVATIASNVVKNAIPDIPGQAVEEPVQAPEPEFTGPAPATDVTVAPPRRPIPPTMPNPLLDMPAQPKQIPG